MDDLALEVMMAFLTFDGAAVAAGAIPEKFKELIVVTASLTTQCPYCIDLHRDNAPRAAAGAAEMLEAAAMVPLCELERPSHVRRMPFPIRRTPPGTCPLPGSN